MARKKEEVQEEVQTPQESVAPESDAKIAYRTLIARYKIQNPVKYARKEAYFLEKLNRL